MKNSRIFVALLSFLFLAVSCGHVMSEREAIKKNDEAIKKLNTGDYDEALDLFKEAIQSPNITKDTRALIYRNVAQIYFDFEEQDSAIHYSRLAAELCDKNSYEYLVSMADVDLLTRHTSEAVIKLKQALTLKPNEMAAHNALGLVYLGDYGEEFKDLEKALGYNKKAFEINSDRNGEFVLAWNYYEMGDYKNAEKHYQNLLDLYPDILDHPLYLGMTKYKLNKKAEAEKLWEVPAEADSSYYYYIEEFKKEN